MEAPVDPIVNILPAAALLCVLSASAWAGPPFLTDDPEPVEFKHWEAYLASQHFKTADGASGTAPHIEANYGAAPNLQLHVIAPIAFSHPTGEATAQGYGDTELGAKFRFVNETACRPQIGTFVLVEAPTGDADRDLGNGKTQVFLPVWFQKSWGPWTTYGGGGYWIDHGEEKKDWIYAGWLLQRNLSKHLTLGGEFFHRTPDTVGGESSTGFTGGGQINFTEHAHLLFSTGRDISGPNQLTGYIAFQWTS
jgi:hypothetical protein